MTAGLRFQASADRMMGHFGEPAGSVTFRRPIGNTSGTHVDITVRARIIGASPNDLAGGSQQAGSRVIVLHDDLAAAIADIVMSGPPFPFGEPISDDLTYVLSMPPWPVPPRVRDKIFMAGLKTPMTVESVDPHTRRGTGEQIGYDIRALG